MIYRIRLNGENSCTALLRIFNSISLAIPLIPVGTARFLSPLAAAGEQDKSKTNSHEVSSLPHVQSLITDPKVPSFSLGSYTNIRHSH